MATMTIKGILSELSRVKAEMGEVSDKNLREASSLLINELREKTPVDTGYAQSRWSLDSVKADEFRIGNDAEYIEQLNKGHSKQAPKFFIEETALKYGKPNGLIVEKK
jgi:hypothetical protein